MRRPEASLSHRVAWAVPAAGALALVAVVLALLAPISALASTSLVFSSTDLTTLGLRPAPTSVASARRQLVAGLPGGVHAALDGALIQASAASGGGQALGSYAFVLRSAAAAGSVLASWRTAHHATTVAVGAGGAVTARSSAKQSLVQVLWRTGARLGLIVLNDTPQTSAARNVAVSYAMLAESFLVAPLPATAWDKVIDQIRPNGSVSRATALQAMALAYGPLPGVRVPSGAASVEESGDLAAAWVLPYLPKLSAPLRRAVYRDLGLTAPGRTARAASFGDPGFTPNAALKAAAMHWAAVYASPGRLNHPLGLQIVAGRTTTPMPGAAADAFPVDASGTYSAAGPYCMIRVATTTTSDLPEILAHETFHCEQFDLDHSWDTDGAWVIEGMAEWAAQTVSPSAADVYLLDSYVQGSDLKLFERAYSAEGFWGHVQDSVPGGLWRRVSATLNAGGPEAIFAAAGATSPSFLTTWGSSVFNLLGDGPAWDIISPIKTSAKPLADTIDAATGAKVLAAPFTTSQYVIDNSDPSLTLLHVQISGYARLGLKENYTDLHDAWFCTGGGGSCVCPSGTTGTPPATQPLTLPDALGLTADPANPEGASGKIVAVSLDHYCTPGPATGLLPEEPCRGLFSLSDFPGATIVDSNTTGPYSGCVYASDALSSPGSPPFAQVLLWTGLPTVADAQTLFDGLARICAPQCAPLHGIGDEAVGGPLPTEKGIPGWKGYERVDNDVLVVASWPGTARSVEKLLSQGDAELLSKSP
jgi:hypothetical protein